MSQLHITSGYAARFAHQNYPIGQLHIPTDRYTQSHTEGHKIMMHPIYLPFTEQQLLLHFADVRQNGDALRMLTISNITNRALKNTRSISRKTIIGEENL